MTLTASVVVITYDREPYLRRLLASLGHLDAAPFEVVVVNGPSTDATVQLLERYRGRIKVRQTPNRNLSESRNLGIAAASGDVIVFIDDDAHPAVPDWLTKFMDVFGADPDQRLACVGGSVLHRDTSDYEFNGGSVSAFGFQSFYDTTDAPAPDDSAWVPRPPGGNAAYRRSALVELGGFDEHYSYYADETDLAYRLWRAGYRYEHLTDNPIRHYRAPSERRIDLFDRNWDVVARSDAYYGAKNGHGDLPLRLLRTARYAGQKHFVGEIDSYRDTGQISRYQWLRLRRQWLGGVLAGLARGAATCRRTGALGAPEAPFLPFSLPAPRRPATRTIALVSEVIAGQPGCGGVGRYTFDLAVALHERGHRVHVICRDPQRRRHHALGFDIHGIGDADVDQEAVSSGRPLADRLATYSLAVLDRLQALHDDGVEIDVVHLTNWNTEGLATLRARLHPTVLMLVTPLGQVVAAERWTLDDDLATVIGADQWQVRTADRVCIPSSGVVRSYQALGIERGLIASMIRTPLGIDPDLTPVAPAKRALKSLLFVGRLERRKGAEILLDVLPKLLERFVDWQCDLVGADVPLVEGGTLRQRFEQMHRRADWTKRVHFHGQVPDRTLRDHYRACDLFVAPSLFESFGLIFHEAMQFGRAVVGCSTGGVAEVVEHGVEGLLVPPGDAAALADALVTLMANDDERARMGRAGEARIRHHQNAMTMAIALESVYGDLANEMGPARAEARRRAWGVRLRTEDDRGSSVEFASESSARELWPGDALRYRVPAGAEVVVSCRTDPHGATVSVERMGTTIARLHTGSTKVGVLCHRVDAMTHDSAILLRVLDSSLDPLHARVVLLGVRAYDGRPLPVR